ncbi:MAG: amylo-alpha-1,6-glucosidase [Acidobacteria bacterium]|nr:amylo-alpha-1,6-glucosidase [Acidobacteriota bacterium]
MGTRAGLFGNESGSMEAWVYPLKIFRNFHLRFLVDGRAVPAESLVRAVTVRPQSSTIIYAGETFSVHETLLVPVHEPGAIIRFEVETAHPLEIEAAFDRDFALEWPAALGGTYLGWDPALRAFYLGEERRKYAAFVGSPSGAMSEEEYQTNYSASGENAIRLGPTVKGRETKIITIAASVNGRGEAETTYRRLESAYQALEEQSADYYREYLSRTVALELEDGALQQAYDWARVSTIQGLVTNPYLGTGLVAGYRTSGMSERPGFAWFFGRDSFWTALALDAAGDFETARTALEFISKYQRADGKVPHEISQGANFVNWFTDYPYAYASADATPLYLIAASDYVRESGDTRFARDRWDSLSKAYQFLRSTYDSRGLPQNFGFGHGWVEGGPLLPVKSELYQSGLGAEALRALSSLARTVGRQDLSDQLAGDFTRQEQLVNQAFWSEESGTYAFALDQNDRRVIEPSVLATVPMWFGLLDEPKARSMLTTLAGPDHETDWGMRIISNKASRYDGGGYHYGSVWPLFTGWASVAEYRYHRFYSAYSNLRANSQLALDGSLGHVTEVLSGDYYEPLSTSSPHQIWSAAMVISPLLRGLFGLETDAAEHKFRLAPHIPADWSSFAIHNLRAGDRTLDVEYHRTFDEITLSLEASGDCSLEFAPALSPRAKVVQAAFESRRVGFQISTNDTDQHAVVRLSLARGRSTLRMRLRNDFGLSYANLLPGLGSPSRGLRITSESWSRTGDALTLNAVGRGGSNYQLAVWNPAQIASVEGGEIRNGKLVLSMPSGSEAYPSKQIVIHFVKAG